MTWHCSSIYEDLHRFARNLKQLLVIVFDIDSEQFYYRNDNKNNFLSKCCKFLANLSKSSEILEQCHVKWWFNYRIYGSVSYSFSCIHRLFGLASVLQAVNKQGYHLTEFRTVHRRKVAKAIISHQVQG